MDKRDREGKDFETTRAIVSESRITEDGSIDLFNIAFDHEKNDLEADGLGVKKIGRYVVERTLGEGGFGEVFLAHDESLKRNVALKVIYRGVFGNSDEELLEESQTLAQLNHPGIVKVHTVGKEGGRLYFVSEYIEGKTLGKIMEEGGLELAASVALIGKIADGLDYAHRHEVIHRDIKPNNIIVTPENNPILIDFGIALVPKIHLERGARTILGTPTYMSPEQARGEGHLVDGRSDVYSLGVILYGLITKQLPFEGDSEDLIEKVASHSHVATSPREINPEISRALERICLKALAKRAADRYQTAADFARDLNGFTNNTFSNSVKTSMRMPIVPKGLRSFDEGDSSFFLQLLPGIRDREGVPDSIRFWQTGIENKVDPFRVGVLYGPSGSGKSSFLKAGLIPLLSPNLEVISVSADVANTEKFLLERLRERLPDVVGDLSLDQCFRRIREQELFSGDGKLLIIVDQFEQWLHANGGGLDSELVAALRQCDGHHIQVILTLRDDFWMGIGKLMEDLDVPLLRTKNCAPLDLFDRDHARKILIEFGRAYGRFSSDRGPLMKDEAKFVEAALSELAQDGKVVPVQLSLFAELAKEVRWSGDSLQKHGGATAIGVEFLDAAFTHRNANPAHRAIEPAARKILEALLPKDEVLIRLRPLSKSVLKERAGLQMKDDAQFTSTMAILDGELRLVTPVEYCPEGREGAASSGEPHYQLTHDYLVPSLRDWVYQKRRNTVKGRAILRLEELSVRYRRQPERRNLPSFFEWLRFHLFTSRSHWTEVQRRMIGVMNRRIALFATIMVAGVLSAVFVGKHLSREVATKELFTEYVESPVLVAEKMLDRIAGEREGLRDMAEGLIEETSPTDPRWLNLAAFQLPEDPGVSEAFFRYGIRGDFDEFGFVIRQLDLYGDFEVDELWDRMEEPSLSSTEKFRTAAALATLVPDDKNWNHWEEEVSRMLLIKNTSEVAGWVEFFGPIQKRLEPYLLKALGDWVVPPALEGDEPNEVEVDGNVTAGLILARFYENQPEKLLELLDRVGPNQLPFVLNQISMVEDFPEHLLRERLLVSSEDEPLTSGRIQAKAIMALVYFGQEDKFWSSLNWTPGDDPRLRSWLIHLVPKCGLAQSKLLDRLLIETNPAVLSAIMLILGSYDSESIGFQNPRYEERVIRLFSTHPDSQVHASSKWLLTKLGRDASELARFLDAVEPEPERNWSYGINGHAMIEIHSQHTERKPSRFLISMTETTIGQYLKFNTAYKPLGMGVNSLDYPVHNISANDARGYCYWLSKREGIEESQLCYRRIRHERYVEYEPVENHYEKTGYRLPSLDEFFYASSGTESGIGLQSTESAFLKEYAWFLDNSDGVCHVVGSLKPTGFGLFDAVGNFQEWCHENGTTNYYWTGSFYGTTRWGLSLTDTGIGAAAIGDTAIHEKGVTVTLRIAKTLE